MIIEEREREKMIIEERVLFIEMIDESKEIVLSSIKTLFTECMHQGKNRDIRSRALTIITLKKGDSHVILSNYRSLCFCHKLPRNWLQKWSLTRWQMSETAINQGSKQGLGLMIISWLKVLIEKAIEYDRSVWRTFIAYEKSRGFI